MSRTFESRRTPIDPEYSTCEFTFAELRIYGHDLDPEEITATLGLQPTTSQKRGELKTGRFSTRTTPIGGWFLSSEGVIHSKDVRDHLAWLLRLIAPKSDQLRLLQDRDDTRMSVDCIWWSAHATGGPALWPEQMRVLSELNLECSFDISFYGNDGDAAVG